MVGYLTALMNICLIFFFLASSIVSTILNKDKTQYTYRTVPLFQKSYWQYFWEDQCIMAKNNNILDIGYNESSLFLRSEGIKYLYDSDYISLKI